MRPSIEPDGKAPSGSLDRRKNRKREAGQTSILDTGEAPFRCAPCRESKTAGGNRIKAAADCSLRAGLRPALRVPRSEQTAAKTFWIYRRGRRQTPDFQHRPEKALAFPLRSMLKVRRLPPGSKVSRVRPQNSGPSTFATLMTASPWVALRSVASRGKTGNNF